MDATRRTLLATGAAVAAAAASGVLSQQHPPPEAARAREPTGKFYVKGDVRVHYQDLGRGFPLLLLPGGGLNSTMSKLAQPFDPRVEFTDEYRCITADLRNAQDGQSSGPLEIDRPWDAYTDDHLGLMDHLGIDKFGVISFCIGGPFMWNLLRRAPDRIVAAVAAQPVGFRPEMPTLLYGNGMRGWGPELVKRRPEITMEMVNEFLTRMFRMNADFVFTVTRDFVRSCKTPLLVLPDDIPAHPYAAAMETVMLAPNSEVSIYPWKEPPERIPIAVRQVRSFLQAHAPPVPPPRFT
jgi:pimeloyl-ACP methyl ester carboxylesterase